MIDIPDEYLDSTYVFIHEDLDENCPIEEFRFSNKVKFYKKYKNFITTSMRQYNILKSKQLIKPSVSSISIKDNIYYLPLNSLEDLKNKLHSNNKLTIGFIGYEYKNDIKNMSLFLNIIKKLDKNIYNICICSNGYVKEKNELINLGYNLISDKHYINILLITSKSEGSPLTLYECIKNNVKCIATDVGNVNQILENYYICDNINDFLDKINDINNKFLKNILFEINCFKFGLVWDDSINLLYKILNDNEINFEINNNTKYLFVSMATINTIYSDRIDSFITNLNNLNLNYYIKKVANYKSWKNNTYIKANFIKECLLKHPNYDIIWIDMDSFINKPLFQNKLFKYDIYIPYINHWKNDTKEAISFILIFKNNNNSLEFINKWIEFNNINYNYVKFEQDNLIDTTKYFKKNNSNIKINTTFFDHSYSYSDLYRFKYPITEIFINQLQFSRRFKKVEYANLKKEVLKELIITTSLTSLYDEVYIIGGGYSIKNYDFNKIKNKFVITVNAAVFLVPSNLFITIDYSFYEKYKKELSNVDNDVLKFICLLKNKDLYIKDYNLFYKGKKLNVNYFDNCLLMKKISFTEFLNNLKGDNLKNYYFDNNKYNYPEVYNSGLAAIVIAASLGFKKINLIGFDGISNEKLIHGHDFYIKKNHLPENSKGNFRNKYDIYKNEFKEFLNAVRKTDININFLTKSNYNV